MTRRTAVLAAFVMAAAAALGAQETSAAGSAGPGATTAQQAPAQAAQASSSATAAPDALPPGFGETEKTENPWRRFEIVSLGAFPISLFYVGFGFDLGRYFGSDFDYRYAPWPFQSSASILPSDSERLVRLASAAVLSLAIGGVDAIIHAGKMRAAQQRTAAKTIELDSAGAGD